MFSFRETNQLTMKNLLPLFLLFFTTSLYCQLFNNFDTPGDFAIQIDSLSADSLWQIGVPAKVNLNEVISAPNALMTDTVNTYPINTDASFIVEFGEKALYEFPYLQLEWFQEIDFEEGVDGGIIDVSYDGGESWLNIFNDTTFLPELVGSYTWDTLHNGQAGLTGVKGLSWMAICWGNPTGQLPQNVTNLQVRFTMTSDSLDTAQDGWLIDNFVLGFGFIGSTANQINFKAINVSPNPTTGVIRYSMDDEVSQDATIYIYDNLGKLVLNRSGQLAGGQIQELAIPDLSAGIYYMFIKTEDEVYRQKVVVD